MNKVGQNFDCLNPGLPGSEPGIRLPNFKSLRYVGLHGAAHAWALSRLACEHPQLFVICKDRNSAEDLVSDLEFFIRDRDLLLYPQWDNLPFEPVSPQALVTAQRLHVLHRLGQRTPYIIVSSIDAAMQRVLSAQLLLSQSFSFTSQDELRHPDFLIKLQACGFLEASLVEDIGEMAVRGNVIDFFPAGATHPIRVEFTDHGISRISTFDTDSQRSLESKQEVFVSPVREYASPQAILQSGLTTERCIKKIKLRGKELEIPPRDIARAMHAFKSGLDFPALELLHTIALDPLESVLSFVPESVPLVLKNEIEINQSSDTFWELVCDRENRLRHEQLFFPKKEALYLSPAELGTEIKTRRRHFIDQLQVLGGEDDDAEVISVRTLSHGTLKIKTQGKVGTGQALQPVRQLVRKLREDGYSIAFIVGATSRAERLHGILQNVSLDAPVLPHLSATEWMSSSQRQPVVILQGHISAGFQLPSEKIAFIAENEIFTERSYRKGIRKKTSLKRLMSTLAQLQDGDFVVHVDYGIALYKGLKHIVVEGNEGDFLHLEYADSRLYVPVQSIAKVQKFSAAEGQKPVLDKLSTSTWLKTKQKVRESVITLAGDLIKLYAARSISSGWRFEPQGAEDDRFADGFPFDETADQLKSINEVLADMASDKPMDRLVCGDVGFGKTEVAIRAAFKCTQHARQVAVLVPTTILVEQHRANFANRFLGYPVKVAALSRFYSAAENKATLASVAEGNTDIVIGTHRLLSQDVQFKDLGLVIIDEEHRFGVKQKEKLKQLKKQVDVLTLTATPIPRTLHMGLLGIRDISIISTPPSDRRVVRTYVAEQSNALVRDTIMRELQRGGQCFVVRNRIEGIELYTQEMRELVPEARFEFAHGQMHENQLEEIMQRFLRHEVDVLVSTTIVESGLDIPNANTIIIDRADTFGLAQLYQLRGRVGRSTRQAYAYLMIPHTRKLAADAQKRLKVLQSLDDLGLGFNLAVRDLEIRGAGNLLGKEQSGSVVAVGFELYSKILKEAVLNLKGEELSLEESLEPEVKLGTDAFIPDTYIPDVSERLLLYQRLASLLSDDETHELRHEIEDRFGPMPGEVESLIELMRLRSFLRRVGVYKTELVGSKLVLSLSPRAKLDAEKIIQLVQNEPGQFKFSKNLTLTVQLDSDMAQKRERVIGFIERLLNKLLPVASH
jgi:transcription-repair coupling factor (superfamily II helicase)